MKGFFVHPAKNDEEGFVQRGFCPIPIQEALSTHAVSAQIPLRTVSFMQI